MGEKGQSSTVGDATSAGASSGGFGNIAAAAAASATATTGIGAAAGAAGGKGSSLTGGVDWDKLKNASDASQASPMQQQVQGIAEKLGAAKTPPLSPPGTNDTSVAGGGSAPPSSGEKGQAISGGRAGTFSQSDAGASNVATKQDDSTAGVTTKIA